ncbi:tripartite tricarboxylate transporter substrate binding protein [Bradyrhizobium sp. AUGA SZCCT0240]|uniref:Bug family tripartite tricarboxylate transporter substrate binding protein n=1 Tax=Bradyrhizobium sp. AUGA SZCCT0240 TaxID=2807669 RepID=UPI001BAACB6D|nr:tripartite tricarboxylate transporter substrate binding protein [Bradyrhizobium sp. AUGA SZCCT0240]MBR1257574.1 tripartite tricarboxylate transporter substrate binding protein [Bradyrhizobium sp. AUGA SZCCT0240]
MNRRRFLQYSISTAAAAVLATASRAQQYPSKIIRFLVGFPPGGSADLTMRQFAHRLDAVLGAKHLIENVPGASSTLAVVQALRAEPDGHTLYLGSNVAQVIAPTMLKLSYDPLTALAPISQVTTNSNLVAVSAGYGVKNWAEFLAKAKGERDGVFYGTSNVGFQIPAVQISKIAGIKLVNIPFKGGAETVTAVLGGNIPMIIGTPPSILPHVNSGALVALCATSAERSSVMPEIPGANEVGLKGMDSVGWFGLFAPAKTPVAVVTRLHEAIQSVIGDKSLQQALSKEGLELRGSASPERFASFQKKEFEETAAIIREAGLAPT